MVVIDAFSKWPEVEVMSSTTTEKTIEVLRSLFARHGLPAQIVTDNGPQFMKRNGIKHIRSAPYNPALAERYV